jgi:amino acid transporter
VVVMVVVVGVPLLLLLLVVLLVLLVLLRTQRWSKARQPLRGRAMVLPLLLLLVAASCLYSIDCCALGAGPYVCVYAPGVFVDSKKQAGRSINALRIIMPHFINPIDRSTCSLT